MSHVLTRFLTSAGDPRNGESSAGFSSESSSAWLGRLSRQVLQVLRPVVGARPAIRMQSIQGLQPVTGAVAEQRALEGDRVAFPDFPLLYLYPTGRRWFIERAPLARAAGVTYRRAGEEVFRPLPQGTVAAEAGMELWDRCSGARLTLFPNGTPHALEG